VLFRCVGHVLPPDQSKAVANGFWTLVEIITPVCLIASAKCETDLVEHLNDQLSHVGIETRYSVVAKSVVGTIRGLPVDIDEPTTFDDMGPIDLVPGRDKVTSIPAPPEMGSFQMQSTEGAHAETIVSVFDAGLKRYLQPRTTVSTALKTRHARGILTCVLMLESPGAEKIAELHRAFPELVLFVSQATDEQNDFVIEQIHEIRQWLTPYLG